MAKKYKIYVRHGKSEGWLYLDENGVAFYTEYKKGKVFRQNEMRSYLKDVNKRGVSNLDLRPHRYRESING